MAQDIVFLHGGNHGAWCWTLVEKALRERGCTARLLSLDMPSCGAKRARNSDTMTIADVAQELVQEVRAAQLNTPILIGHSIAGVLLPKMGSLAPELFSELCFLTAAMPSEGQSIANMMGTGVHGINADVVGWPIDPESCDPATLLEAMFLPDVPTSVAQWAMAEIAQDKQPACLSFEPVIITRAPTALPVSYIVTLRDPILPPGWQGRFAERVGTNRLFQIDTPHEPMLSHPDLLAEFILDRVIR